MFRGRRSQADFDAEIEAHLQIEIDRLRESGLRPEDAEAAARRVFGNVTAVQERNYERGRRLFWDRLTQDVRFALRLLARRAVLTAAIVATLALGIGATSAVFSLVHAVVLRPLAYDEPDGLVQVYETGLRSGGEADWVTFPNFRDWRSGSHVFQEMAAYRYALLTLTGPEGAESVLGLETTDRLFAVLRVPPLLGRTFLPGEDAPGRPSVTVLSHSFWRRRDGADPQVVGRSVSIDGTSYSIVGVMPASFRFPNAIPGDTVVPIDLWIPMRASDDREDRGSHNFWSVARLAGGVSLDEARAAMAKIADNLARQYPDTNKDMGVMVKRLKDYVSGNVRPALLVMLGAVGLVLLLTCTNIAILLLSRAEARRREMAVRHALGASRGRLVRQTLTESLVLAAAGAFAGLAVAHAGTRLLVRFGPASIPRLEQTTIDTQVLLFAAAVSVCVGILFGLAPARPHERLQRPQRGGHASIDGRRGAYRSPSVAAFAALALLLAAIGIYGVIAHGVAQRNREIGVRLAVGARPQDVVALVLRNGMALTVAGTSLGLAGAVALSRTLASLLFAVSPFDPATYGSVAGVLMLVAGVSAYIPSRGAAKVDPLVTLRDE